LFAALRRLAQSNGDLGTSGQRVGVKFTTISGDGFAAALVPADTAGLADVVVALPEADAFDGAGDTGGAAGLLAVKSISIPPVLPFPSDKLITISGAGVAAPAVGASGALAAVFGAGSLAAAPLVVVSALASAVVVAAASAAAAACTLISITAAGGSGCDPSAPGGSDARLPRSSANARCAPAKLPFCNALPTAANSC
jgi:hypothetical protein